MRYVVMVKDELGDEHRAFGSEFLEAKHSFPSFDEEDEAMQVALEAWKTSIEDRAQSEWNETFGPESRVFLERDHSDMSLREMAALGWGEL